MTTLTATPCFLAITLLKWECQYAVEPAAPDEPVDPARALVRLAQACMRWTPRVHIETAHGPPAVLLDLTGCLPVHGGVARVRRRVERALQRRQLAYQLGVARTAGAALAAALAPEQPQTLDQVPVTALRLDPATLAGLHEVHVHTVGQLCAIDRHALADRFGPVLAARVDAVTGARPWPFQPVAPPDPIMGECVFASPCTQLEAVEHGMQVAIQALCQVLDQRVRGVSTLEVLVERARMPTVRGRMHFGAPTRDPAHLWSLLRPRLERMSLGCLEHGMGVERIALRAVRLQSPPCSAVQQAVGQLVDQLAARLGPGSVRAARPRHA